MIHLIAVKTGPHKYIITSSDCEDKDLRKIQDQHSAEAIFGQVERHWQSENMPWRKP